MIECDTIIEGFQRLTREQLDLALIAAAVPVAAMHIDLALFGVDQARFVEWLCDDGDVRGDMAWARINALSHERSPPTLLRTASSPPATCYRIGRATRA